MKFYTKVCCMLVITYLVYTALPTSVFAQTATRRNTSSVAAQIAALQAEVQKLQARLLVLQQQENTSARLPVGPYDLRFFDRGFDSIYKVDGVALTRVGGLKVGTHADERELFALLVAVAGEQNLKKYVHEWRVFNDKGTDLGAFVESIAGTNKWVIGINRAYYDDASSESIEAFAELLTHEFAHILLSDKGDFVDDFEDTFWTRADQIHADRIEDIPFDDRAEELERYYQNNERRFVSDYATSNVAEDMAETFVEFVFTDAPSSRLVRNQKILFFYTDDSLLDERDAIVSRLKAGRYY